jgi:hypothetical protein
MPVLTPSKEILVVNGYRSKLFTYINPTGINYKVWISETIPYQVNPGFYFVKSGGITKVEYTINNTVWSLDLVKYREKSKAVIPAMPAGNVRDTTLKLHPFFNVK